MSILNKNELADKTNSKVNTVKMAMKRGSLKHEKYKVDDLDPQNIYWIVQRNPAYYHDKIKNGWKFPSGYDKLERRLKKLGLSQYIGESQDEIILNTAGGESFEHLSEQELKKLKLKEEIKLKKKDISYREAQKKLTELKQKQLEGELIHVDLIHSILDVYIPMEKRLKLSAFMNCLNDICDYFKATDEIRAKYTDLFQKEFERSDEILDKELRASLDKLKLNEKIQ